MKRIISIALALVLVFCLTGCQSSDYKAAVSKMESGSYAEALTAFQALGDYKDSAAQATECSYKLAVAEFDAGNYDAAKAAFTALGDYKDGAEYIKKCDYIAAKALFEAEKYEEAVAALTALGDYEDCAELASQAANILEMKAVSGTWSSGPMAMDTSFLEVGLFGGVLGFEAPEVTMENVLTLTEDGKYTMTANIPDECIESYEEALYAFVYVTYMVQIEANLDAQGYTLEDLYAELGTDDPMAALELFCTMPFDDYMGYLFAFVEESLDTNNMTQEGTFTISDGALLMDGEETSSTTFDAAADTITVEDKELQDLFGAGVDTMVFTR